MSLLPLLDDDQPNQAARLAPKLRELADQGIYFGTSSWKYEGWLGSIYTPERYTTRGKFSRKKFEAECLAEYAETFPLVCGDFTFYQFPTPDYWRRLFDETPASLLFGFKVPEEITVATWPGHARYGPRAGLLNEAFLDARHFERGFARPLEPYRDRVATLIFEFGTFAKASFSAPRAFTRPARRIPRSAPRRVPLRGRDPQPRVPRARLFLHAGKPQCPPMSSTPGRGCPRSANRPGCPARSPPISPWSVPCCAAVAPMSRRSSCSNPIEPPRSLIPSTREAMRQIAEQSRRDRRTAFLFVNNRLEGNAPATIEAVVSTLCT